MPFPPLKFSVFYLGSGNFDRRSEISVIRWTHAQTALSRPAAADPIHATLYVDSSGVQLTPKASVADDASANGSVVPATGSKPVSTSSINSTRPATTSTGPVLEPTLPFSHRGTELLRVIPLSGRVSRAGPTDLCYTTRAPHKPHEANMLRCQCHFLTVPDPLEVRQFLRVSFLYWSGLSLCEMYSNSQYEELLKALARVCRRDGLRVDNIDLLIQSGHQVCGSVAGKIIIRINNP